MRFKLFTIEPPKTETNSDNSLTCYEINNFLNAKGEEVHPTDISAEFNELTGKMLISVGYKDQVSVFESIANFIKKKVNGRYQIRFTDLCDYSEKNHNVYLQLELENAVNYNTHETISHGIFVENGRAKVAFLEYEKTNEE